VRAHGGVVLGPMTLPDGTIIAACNDPQSPAFGLTLAGAHRRERYADLFG
jgi:predicted enzyme related to lactoylglutathione lyase